MAREKMMSQIIQAISVLLLRTMTVPEGVTVELKSRVEVLLLQLVQEDTILHRTQVKERVGSAQVLSRWLLLDYARNRRSLSEGTKVLEAVRSLIRQLRRPRSCQKVSEHSQRGMLAKRSMSLEVAGLEY
jgi:hypothetical protein